MPKVAIEISGVLSDKLSRTQRPVNLKGTALVLEIPDNGGGEPPGIWGPPGPWPQPPIHLPPEGGDRPHPEHPIVLPEPPEPEVPPGTPPDTVVKSAPEGGWGYYTDTSGVAYSAYRPRDDEPGPKK